MAAIAADDFEVISTPKIDPNDFEVVSQPENDFEVIATPQKPIGQFAGAGRALQRGVMTAQGIPEVIAAAGMAGVEKPSIRQERKAYVDAMTDPRYTDALIREEYQGNDPIRLQKIENRLGSAGKLDMAMTRARAIQEATANQVAADQAAINAVPKSAAQQRLANAATVSEKWAAWRQDPIEITASIALESLPPSIAGAVIGTATLGPGAGTAIGAGGASGMMTFSGEFLGNAGKLGYDVSDPQQLTAFLQDDAAFEVAFEQSIGKAGIVGSVDSATAGLAGRFIGPALKQGFRAKLIATAKELTMQAVGGAGGEVLGQSITGQPLDTFDVAMEGMAEIVSSPGEIGLNLRPQRAATVQPQAQQQEQAIVDGAKQVMTAQPSVATADASPESDFEVVSMPVQQVEPAGEVSDQNAVNSPQNAETPNESAGKNAVIKPPLSPEERAQPLTKGDLEDLQAALRGNQIPTPSKIPNPVAMADSASTQPAGQGAPTVEQTQATVAPVLVSPESDQRPAAPFKAGDTVIYQDQPRTIKRMSPDGQFAVIGKRAIPVRELTAQSDQFVDANKKVQTIPFSARTILDDVKESGGIGGIDLETAMRRMDAGEPASKITTELGGEYDALANVLETIHEARKSGKQFAQYRDLAQAYERAGFNRRGRADEVLQSLRDSGRAPESESALIDQVWEAAQGRSKTPFPQDAEGKAELFWQTATEPQSKVGLKRITTDQLKVGTKFRLRGKGLSHEEMVVTHIDPDTGTVTIKDGVVFGVQELPEGVEIYVTGAEDVLNEPGVDNSAFREESQPDGRSNFQRWEQAKADATRGGIDRRDPFPAASNASRPQSFVSLKESFQAELKRLNARIKLFPDDNGILGQAAYLEGRLDEMKRPASEHHIAQLQAEIKEAEHIIRSSGQDRHGAPQSRRGGAAQARIRYTEGRLDQREADRSSGRELFEPTDDFQFSAPESIAEQKARLKREAAKRNEATAKERMQEKAQSRLTGQDIDTTQEMFGAEVKVDKTGQGSLFESQAEAQRSTDIQSRMDRAERSKPREASPQLARDVIQRNGTVRGALTAISQSESVFAPLAKALLQSADAKSLTVKVSVDPNVQKSFWSPAGSQSERITFSPGATQDTFRIMHELLHALTAVKVRNNPQMLALFEEAKRALGTNEYGFTKVEEFIVEAFGNPEFQSKLDSIKPAGKESLWTRFKQIIARALGLMQQQTLLDQVLREGAKIVIAERDGSAETTDLSEPPTTEILNRIAQSKYGRNYAQLENGDRAIVWKEATAEMDGRLNEPQTDTEEFKRWFSDSKVVDDNGKPLVVYSGHSNAEIYGNRYNPKAGTAGGFYATEDPKIASNYASGKMGSKEYYENGEQYKFKLQNGKWGKKLHQMELTPEQQSKAREFLSNDERVIDLERRWKDNAPYDIDARRALARGGLRDLISIWKQLESDGYNIAYAAEDNAERTIPFTERQRKNTFEELLDHLGIEWQSRDWVQPGVFPLYLKIRNPIDAAKPFPSDLLDELKRITKSRRNVDAGNTHWTKDYPLKEWVQRISEGDEYWTTQIPSEAVPILKRFGYDGIKELGLKQETDRSKRQINWIAFDPHQIKSASGNVGSFGQRLVTRAEAKRHGMTMTEANREQSAGSMLFEPFSDESKKSDWRALKKDVEKAQDDLRQAIHVVATPALRVGRRIAEAREAARIAGNIARALKLKLLRDEGYIEHLLLEHQKATDAFELEGLRIELGEVPKTLLNKVQFRLEKEGKLPKSPPPIDDKEPDGEPPPEQDKYADMVERSFKRNHVIPHPRKRLAQWLRLLRESATDTLRRAGGNLSVIANAYDAYTDKTAEHVGQRMAPFIDLLGKLSTKQRKTVQAEFEEYLLARELGTKDPEMADLATLKLLESSDMTKKLVGEVEKLFTFTSAESQRIGVKVYNPELKQWRKIGSYGKDYWPRILKKDIRRILFDPNIDPKRYDELVKEVAEYLGITDLDAAEMFIHKNTKVETAHDYLSNLEAARQKGLPQHFYEHRFERLVPAFISSWAQRISQIEAFGQKTEEGTQDLFDSVLENITDRNTRNYLIDFRKRTYEEERRTPGNQLLAHLRAYTVATKLSNPWSALRNLSSIAVNTFPEFGLDATTRAIYTTLTKHKDAIKSAQEAGMLRSDLIAGWVESNDFSETQQKVINATLKAGGFKTTEEFNRAVSGAAALNWARWNLKNYAKKPGNRASLLFKSKLSKMGIKLEDLQASGLTGETARKLMRQGGNMTQFSYNIGQAPLWSDTPAAKFLFQFMKFGLQQARRTTDVIDEAFRGRTVDGRKVHNFEQLTWMLAMMALSGAGLMWLREFLFDKKRKDATLLEIRNAADEDKMLAMKYATQRLFHDAIYAGGFGILGDFAGSLENLTSRMRGKTPIDPPAMGSIKNVWENLVIAGIEQEKWPTLDDWHKALVTELPMINYGGSMVLKAADTLEADWDAAQLQTVKSDLSEIKTVSYRFADEMEMERTKFRGTFSKTPKTKVYNELQNALLLGDVARAVELRREILDGAGNSEARKRALLGMKSSVNKRRPFLVGGLDSDEQKEFRGTFKAWLIKRRPELVPQLEKLDSTYIKTARAAGVMN